MEHTHGKKSRDIALCIPRDQLKIDSVTHPAPKRFAALQIPARRT